MGADVPHRRDQGDHPGNRKNQRRGVGAAPDQQGARHPEQCESEGGDDTRDGQLPRRDDRTRAPATRLAVGERRREHLPGRQGHRHGRARVDHRQRPPLAHPNSPRGEQLLLHAGEGRQRHGLGDHARGGDAPMHLGQRTPGFVEAGGEVHALPDQQGQQGDGEHPAQPPPVTSRPGSPGRAVVLGGCHDGQRNERDRPACASVDDGRGPSAVSSRPDGRRGWPGASPDGGHATAPSRPVPSATARPRPRSTAPRWTPGHGWAGTWPARSGATPR